MVAQLPIRATLAGGEQRLITVWIGTPTQEPTGEWCCPAGLDGLHDGLGAMHGDDALQSLCLAMGLVAALLRDHVAAGGQLHYVGGEEFPLEAYFGWVAVPGPAS
jgi:hypothetical protein